MTVTAPTLQTARLTLRPLAMDDHAAYLGFVTSERARPMGGPFAPPTAWAWLVNDAGQWALQGFGGLAIERDGIMVGQVSVTQGVTFPEPELGWFLLDGQEGHGFAREAAAALRDHVRDRRRVGALVSYVGAANARSIRLAEALGAVHDPAAAQPPGPDCRVYRHAVAA